MKGRALEGVGQQSEAASAYLSSLALDVENVGTREQLNKVIHDKFCLLPDCLFVCVFCLFRFSVCLSVIQRHIY